MPAMTNKAIAGQFQFLANIMELHGENPFKIRSYQNAYLVIRKLDLPLSELSDEEISSMKGIGKAISAKIRELLDTGRMETLEKYREKTPEGVQDMLGIRGLGPKKLGMIWKQLEIESVGELLYAINENRLLELKGFGKKVQAELKQAIEYFQQSKGYFHFATLEKAGEALMGALKTHFPDRRMDFCGEYRRHNPTLQQIGILIEGDPLPETAGVERLLQDIQKQEKEWNCLSPEGFPVQLLFSAERSFAGKLFDASGSKEFVEAFHRRFPDISAEAGKEEVDLFALAGLPFIPAPLREKAGILDNSEFGWIEEKQIKGLLHAHSTYSDGQESLANMAEAVRKKGYQYFGITDHSKSAFYANGLNEARVLEQFAEIEKLNEAYGSEFTILKGIESDILYDGSLDYPDEFLKGFDFVIASIHSQLKMDEEKATERLIRAIEHPATNILGHPTGRLLLSRKGYPVNHHKVIDACVANGVALELNANPYRLDLDWTWIPYVLEKGGWIAINPDAHSLAGIDDVHFGILAAQKGGLRPDRCVNALDLEAFVQFCSR